jgi:hypothetical protein
MIALWKFLCTISMPNVLPGGEVVIERATFEALTCSKLAIGVCMRDFIPERGANIVQEEEDDDDAEV